MGAEIDVSISRDKAISVICRFLNSIDDDRICEILKIVNDNSEYPLGYLRYFYIGDDYIEPSEGVEDGEV